ncbi:glycosyltransferase family 4 protein [Prochlorococcus marinus]|uniref:glycosyltransferase family 4 protein n=1 Tax=Prochlorococcus marinus TaxID=1219 RepID=UPI0039AFA660
MKKVAFLITRSDEIGGAHIHVRDLCISLKKDNYNPVVIVGGSGLYIDELKKNDIPFIQSSIIKREINIIDDIRSIIFLIKLLNSIKPTFISSHSAKAGFLLRVSSLIYRSSTIIFTAHGWSFSYGIPFFKRVLYYLVELILGRLADAIITVCHSDYNLALKYKITSKNKLFCIHNGMPIKSYQLKKFSSINKVKFISVARFENQKDHYSLIKSFSKVSSDDWELLLIGDGPNKSYIQEMVCKYNLQDKIYFLGRSSNVETYLNNSDVFILSSLWEGFPRSIIEAMRSSMPIIATDVGGCKESVIHSYNGYLYKRKNITELTRYIQMFINNKNLISIFGNNSFDLYKEKFTYETMYKNTKNIYTKLEASSK